MARVTHTNNTNSTFETNKVISHENMVGAIEFIKDTYSIDKPDVFWIGAMAERWFETAVFFALQSELKGFDCSDVLTVQLKGIEGMTNTYQVDFEPSLTFTKDNFFSKNKLSITAAQVDRLRNYGPEYGLIKKLDVLQALDYIKKMNKESKEYIRLNDDAELKMATRMEKVNAIWSKVEMLQARTYPDSTLLNMYDIPESQIYHMITKMDTTFDSARRSLLGKASIAGIDDNERDEAFFLTSSASAGLVSAYCKSLIKEADQVDNSNTSEEISRDGGLKDESESEMNRIRYEAENNLPHGTVG